MKKKRISEIEFDRVTKIISGAMMDLEKQKVIEFGINKLPDNQGLYLLDKIATTTTAAMFGGIALTIELLEEEVEDFLGARFEEIAKALKHVLTNYRSQFADVSQN